MSDDQVIEPYGLHAMFERDLLYTLANDTAAYGRVGEYIEPEAFSDPLSPIVCKVIAQCIASTGRPPGGMSAFLQELENLAASGGISFDQRAAVAANMVAASQTGFDPETVVAQFGAVIKSRRNRTAIESAILAHSNPDALVEIGQQLQNNAQIGVVDVSVGDDLSSLQADLEETANVPRLSFGCPELDAATGGGRAQGEFGFVLGPPKTGKSAWLVQDAVTAVRQGLNTVVITLELPSVRWRARFLAGITAVPTNAIIKHPKTTIAWKVFDDMKGMAQDTGLPFGRFQIKKMPAGSTTLLDVLSYVSRVEQHWGEQADVVVIDYMDKMRGQDTTKGMYEQMLEVYEGGRLWAELNGRWMSTASQTKGHVKEGDMPNLADCADSQNKVRVTDWMLGIQKMLDPTLIGQVSLRLIAGRNYEETNVLGPYKGGAEFGVFLHGVAGNNALINVIQKV